MFVGRIGELARLDVAVNTRPGVGAGVVVQAVHGLGGIGKSALAAHYAATHTREFNPIWWITAESPARIDAGLASFAVALQPALNNLVPAEVLRERAVQWLATHTGWLLVLDNVTDKAHVQDLLARVPTGRFVITSRRASGWHGIATPVRLDVLTASEAEQLLFRILTHGRQLLPGRRVGLTALCSELGNLPLALEQAGAYIAETGITPADYLALLAAYPATMYRETAEGGDPQRTIARIWRVTLDRLTVTPLAGQVLRILAFYAPQDIPNSLLDGLDDPPTVMKAIRSLAAYSMITSDNGFLAVHRLVQTVSRTPDSSDPHRRQDLIDQARDEATALLTAATPATWEDPAGWLTWRYLVPHVDALAEHTDSAIDTQNSVTLLGKTAQFLLNQGASVRAISLMERALNDQVRFRGNDHSDTVAARSDLADAYLAAGKLGKAIVIYERTVADHVKILGDDHPQTLESRDDLACAYADAGDTTSAIPLFERNLTDCLRVLGEDHPLTLSSRNNLARTYLDTGDLDRAIPLLERNAADRARILGTDHWRTLNSRINVARARLAAGDLTIAVPLFEETLADCVRVLGEDHPLTLASGCDLASAYLEARNLTKAIPLFEQGIADCVRALSEEHPYTLTTRANLASAYITAGDPVRAIPLLEQGIADCVRALGGDHPLTLAYSRNLPDAYVAAGDPDRAIPLFEQALADSLRVLGKDHQETLTVRNQMARAYQAVGDLTTAERLYHLALSDCVRVLGVEHPLTLSFRSNLANVYVAAGDLARAILLFERALADCVRVLGEDHPDTLTVRNNLARAYGQAGDLTKAIPLFERTLAYCVRVLGEDQPLTLDTRNELALACQDAGDLTKAIPLFERALAGHVRVLGEDHPDTLTVRNNLARAYGQAGDLTKAIPLFAEALADCMRVLGNDHPITKILRVNFAKSADHLMTAYDPTTDSYGAKAILREPSWLSQLVGQRELTLTSAEKAVAILRQSAYACPAKFAPDLARSLRTLSERQWDSGHHDDALADNEQAVQILRRLARLDKERFARDLASALKFNAIMLFARGQRAEALRNAEEALAINRTLVESHSSSKTELALSLNLCGTILKWLGQYDEALAYLGEAISAFDEQVGAEPGAHTNDLRSALVDIAEVLDHLGRSQHAAAARRRIEMLG